MTDSTQKPATRKPAGKAPAKGGASKSPRRRAREFVLQGLYQWRIGGADEAAIEAHVHEIAGFDKADRNFFLSLLRGILKQRVELVAAIEPHLDRKFDELSPIEASILLLGGYELHRLRVTRVNYRKRLKGSGRIADADQHSPAVVHFQRPAEPDRFLPPEVFVTRLVHDDRIGSAEICQRAFQHLHRRADPGGGDESLAATEAGPVACKVVDQHCLISPPAPRRAGLNARPAKRCPNTGASVVTAGETAEPRTGSPHRRASYRVTAPTPFNRRT